MSKCCLFVCLSVVVIKLNQLEKLEAARAAWLVGLSLKSLNNNDGFYFLREQSNDMIHWAHINYYDEDTMVTFVTFPACVSLRNRDLNSFCSLCGMKIFEPWWTGYKLLWIQFVKILSQLMQFKNFVTTYATTNKHLMSRPPSKFVVV